MKWNATKKMNLLTIHVNTPIVVHIFVFGNFFSIFQSILHHVESLLFIFLMNSWIFATYRNGRKPDYDTKDLYKPLKSHKSDILGGA